MADLEMIREGLLATPKRLPSVMLYDELGSVLFEAITLVPEYEVARVDAAMLSAHIGEALGLISGVGAAPLEIVELGPGHGRKARVVLEQVLRRQAGVSFYAIDISRTALHGCQRNLEDLSGVAFTAIEATFLEGLARLPPAREGHRRVVFFLGSNLSNFDRVESLQFLKDVRAALRPGDALVLSADLEKPPERLLSAYDDALGVTAAFDKNLLVQLNRDFGADFPLDAFTHEARWNASARRVEMHLRATRACEVQVPRLELCLRFTVGETIWTESSHRFSVAELLAWGEAAGLPCRRSWVDEAWPLALALFVVAP